MSVTAVSRALSAPRNVTGAARWTLLILCEYADDEGYSYPKISTIARRAALKREETVREALRQLESDGYIERIVNGWAGVRGQIPEGKRPNLYRIHIDAEGRPTGPKVKRSAGGGAARPAGTPAPQDSGSSGSPSSGDQNRHGDPSGDPDPPNPPDGGDDESGQPQLFNGSNGGATTRRSRRARDDAADAELAEWWKRYPAGKKRGPRPYRAWRKARAKLTLAALDDRLANYLAARRLYEDHHGVAPPLMMGATFLNSKGEMWDGAAWTIEDCAEYWPAPGGGDWSPDAGGRVRSVSEILAESGQEARGGPVVGSDGLGVPDGAGGPQNGLETEAV